MYSLRLLGVPSLEGAAGPVAGRVAQRRRLTLLALLASAPDRSWTRDQLVGLLWPDRSDKRARHLLADSIYIIRQALGDDAIRASGEVVRLNAERVRTDCGAFEAAIAEGRLVDAAALYRGPFLQGFHAGDTLELERWVDRERTRLADLHATTLEALAQQAEDAADHATAVTWWQRVARESPYDTRVAVRLMQAMTNAGAPAEALEHARVHQLRVQTELGGEPAPELGALVERLKRELPALSDVAAELDETISRSGAAAKSALARRLFREIHRRLLWQVLLVYAATSWVVFAVIHLLTRGLGLPPWFPPLAAMLLLVGLPIVITTALVQEGRQLARQPERSANLASTSPPVREPGKSGAQRLFTWRNAISGGVLALALWGMVAAGWLLLQN